MKRILIAVAGATWLAASAAAFGQTTPFAHGFRGPENLAFDGEQFLYVSDTDHLWQVSRDGATREIYARDPAADGISLGGVSRGPDGGIYFSAGNRILIYRPPSGAVEELVKGIAGFANGNCFDDRGNFFIADSDAKKLLVVPAGTRELKTLDAEAGWINGLVWSGRDHTLYFTISAPGRVGGYRLSDDGLAIKEKVTVANFPFGGLDDLTLDAAGNFYVCLWLNGKVMKVTPAGDKQVLLEKLDGPSAVEFGPGAEADTLYLCIKGGNTKFLGTEVVRYRLGN